MGTEVARLDATRVLSLDGGDIRCLSQLMILQELMHRVEADAGKSILPCEFFHSMTGVGAGGVIVIFLGVLRMSLEAAIATFAHIGDALFCQKAYEIEERSSKLENLIKKLLIRQGLSVDTRLRDSALPDSSCKVSICYMSAVNLGPCRLLRSYTSRHVDYNPTIVEAIRIAWATPGVFSPVLVGPGFMREELVNAVNGASNPTFEAVKEANEALGGLCRISCLLSLGAGKRGTSSVSTDGLLEQTAHDTEATAGDLQSSFAKLGVYFRFSVEHGLDSEQVKLGIVIGHTSSYLQDVMISQRLDECAAASARTSSICLNDLLCHPGRVLRPDHGLPPLSAFYIARKEPMDFIVKAMLGNNHAKGQRIVIISALGGSGKTQLAIKFARDQDETYDHIIFVDASSKENLRIGLINRIKSLDPGCNPTSIDEARQLLTRLTGPISRNWLLVLDNADDPNVDLTNIFPHCDHGCILITTRNPTLGNLAPESHLVLDAMNSQEAVDVLLSTALGAKSHRSDADVRHATTIVHRLGHLPLAIVQAGCYIKMRKCLRTYLELLEQNRDRLLRSPAKGQRDSLKYDHSVYAAFDVTLDALSPRSLQILSILSFLHFSHFPWHLIKLAIACSFAGERFDLLERGKDFAESIHLLQAVFCSAGTQSDEVLDQVLLELQQYSLVTLVTIHNVVTLRLHPLLHAWAQDRLSRENRHCFRAAAIRLIMCGACMEYSDIWEFVVPHMARFSMESEELHINDKAALAMVVYDSNRDSKALLKSWKSISQTVRVVHGESHIRRTRASLELAAAHWENGQRLLGEWLTRRVVEIRTKTLGARHPDALESMVRLARILRKTGHTADATSLCATILSLRQKDPQPQNNYKGEELYQLGRCHMASRRFREAADAFDRLLTIRKALRGNSHREVTQVMYSLAHCYDQLGDLAGAEVLRRGALEVRTSTHGAQHNRTLAAMTLLAESLCQQHIERAEKLFREVIRLRKESPQDFEGEIIYALTRLAEVLTIRQRHAEAEPFWREVIIGRGRLRSDEKSLLYSLNSLAETLYHQARFNASELTWRYVLKRSRTSRLPDPILYEETLDATYWLAVLLTEQERHSEAQAYWREAVQAQVMKSLNSLTQPPIDIMSLSNYDGESGLSIPPSNLSQILRFAPISQYRNPDQPHDIQAHLYSDANVYTSNAPHQPQQTAPKYSSPDLQSDSSSEPGHSHPPPNDSIAPSTFATPSPLTLHLPTHLFFDSHSARVLPYPTSNNLPRALNRSHSVNVSPHHLSRRLPREKVGFHPENMAPCYPSNGLSRVMANAHPVHVSQSGSAYVLLPECYYGAAFTPMIPVTSALYTFELPLPLEFQETTPMHELFHLIMNTSDAVLSQQNQQINLHGIQMECRAIGSGPVTSEGRSSPPSSPSGPTVTSGLLTHPRATVRKENTSVIATSRLRVCCPSILQDIEGPAVEAKDTGSCTRSMAIWKDVPGAGRRLVRNTSNHELDNTRLGLANCLSALGNYAEAEHALYQATISCRESLGDSHYNTLYAASQYAITVEKQGNWADAEAHWRSVTVWHTDGLDSHSRLTRRALCHLADLLYNRKAFAEAAPLYDQIRKQTRSASESDQVLSWHALHRLAEVTFYQGNYEAAEPLLQKVVDRRYKELGPSNTLTLQSSCLLAETFYYRSKFEQAQLLYRDVLQWKQHMLNEDIISALQRHAEIMSRQGDHAAAEPLLRELYEEISKKLGGLNLATIDALSKLAKSVEELKRDSEAERLYQELLNSRRRYLGNEHIDTLATLNILSTLMLQREHFADAEPLIRELHVTNQKKFGNLDLRTLESLSSLSDVVYALGNYKEAETLSLKLLGFRQKALGNDHGDISETLNRLPAIYLSRKEYAAAEHLLRHLYESRRRTLGDESPSTSDSLALLANVLFQMGRDTEAEPLYSKLLDLRRKTVGNQHEDTLHTLSRLADITLRQKQYQKAKPILLELYEIREKVLGTLHPEAQATLSLLADTVDTLGQDIEATILYQRLLKARECRLGDEHEATIHALYKLVMSMLRQETYAAVEPFLRRLYHIYQSKLGDSNPATLGVLSALADATCQLGNDVNAEPLYDELLRLRREILGKEHDDTLHAVYQLAVVVFRQERYDDAERLLRGLYNTRLLSKNQSALAIIESLSLLATTVHKAGKEADALHLYEDLLRLRKDALGSEHADTLEVASMLAQILEKQKCFPEARKAQRQAQGLPPRSNPHGILHNRRTGRLVAWVTKRFKA